MTVLSKRLRIAHFSPLDYTKGGISTVVSNYRASALASNFEMTFVATHSDGTFLAKLIVAVRAAACALKMSLFKRPDIIHVHVGDFPSVYRKALITAPLRRRTVHSILHFHGAAFLTEYRKQPKMLRWFIRRYLQRFDKIVCLAEDWRVKLNDEFALENTIVIPNAVPSNNLPESGPRMPGEPLRMLFLGSIGTRKGIFDLLAAMEMAVGHGANVELRIGGNGAVDELKSRIQSSTVLRDRAHYLGWVNADQRERAFVSSHLYVLPSHAEGMPMSVLEAMSHRLPVLSTPVGGIPELVGDGISAVLVQAGNVEKLAEAICKIEGDETGRAKMAAAARERIENNFSFKTHLQLIEKTYYEIKPNA